MAKGKPLVNLQARVEQETFDLFEETKDRFEFETKGAFMEVLLEKFLNPKTVTETVSRPEDQAEIESLKSTVADLQSEINRLTETYSEIGNRQNEEITAQITDLEHQLFRTKQELTLIQQNQTTLDPDTIIIPLNPAMSELVDKCVNVATRKTGTMFTRNDIFQNLFWEALTNGRASLPVIFSSGEIAKILEKHRKPETTETENTAE